ncbi:hypothetical protein ACFU53_44445 [Streptomyces sp. NPDC057474]
MDQDDGGPGHPGVLVGRRSQESATEVLEHHPNRVFRDAADRAGSR